MTSKPWEKNQDCASLYKSINFKGRGRQTGVHIQHSLCPLQKENIPVKLPVMTVYFVSITIMSLSITCFQQTSQIACFAWIHFDCLKLYCFSFIVVICRCFSDTDTILNLNTVIMFNHEIDENVCKCSGKVLQSFIFTKKNILENKNITRGVLYIIKTFL